MKQQSPRWIHDKITEMLLYQKASLQYTEEVQANIDKFVDAEVRKIVTTEHEGIERRYDKHLESLGLTIDDIRQQLRREVIITSFLQQEIRPKIVEPTRADLLAAYKENVQKWSKPPRKAMSLIDVRVRDRLGESAANPSQEQLDSARAEARSIIESAQQELRSGTEFSEVAKRYSDGLHKLEGGSWGWVSAGSVRARFEPAVGALYQLEENGFSDIIESQDAFFIVKCDQFDPGHTPTFQQAQPVLREEYNRIAYNQLIAELVTELRNKAHIEPRNLEPFHNAVVAEALALQTAGPQ
ncbi:MAG: peptidylprolyl isomerase [Phycisphaerales bacterium]|nr:MAG: peptidylprolyl isomerase [Phycisphaerales bacterium]